ncbi:Abhydrolase_6 domain-containing protein [Cephalotus follicularis]|uniref:Abhydrolase_6 domain-containing protein n=1 Tax=Cephalotus follicularis TaxID=3775 RepID=A0A1Q3CR44_CEPFO|nr:Abhydrolase_6 domain-containing protein [Cephalotus follicularis]
MELTKLWHLLTFYLSTIQAVFRDIFSGLLYLNRTLSVLVMDKFLSLYFKSCDLSPCTIDLDNQTTMHFWSTNHRRFNKPILVMLHGYGSNSKWQFLYQVNSLSRSFNLYVPDLLFFGKSYTNLLDRTDGFQARCVVRGLERLGVDRFSVYGLSYGGFVAYRMAEMYPEVVEKVVIVSSGVGCTRDQKGEHLRKVGRRASDILVPNNPRDLRLLVNLSMHKHEAFKWFPDFLLQQFVNVMYKDHRKEKIELIEYLLEKETVSNLPVLTQETLIIWGDKDNVFPVQFAHQLHRYHLGPKSRLEIIKDTGHAANMESPDAVNRSIKSFVLGTPDSLHSLGNLCKQS